METIASLDRMGISPGGRILVVMPHPDDEAVFVAGLIKTATRKRLPVRVITATLGEKSTLRHGLTSAQDLAGVRHSELVMSFTHLGVTDFRIFTYPDGSLEDAERPLTRMLIREMKTFSPSHVVTLEPDGIYGHPDHIALSRVVRTCAPRSVRLLYATVSPAYIFPTARSMAKKKIIRPIQPEFRLGLGMHEVRAKLASLRAHRTQFNLHAFHLEPLWRLWRNDMVLHEYFAFGHAAC